MPIVPSPRKHIRIKLNLDVLLIKRNEVIPLTYADIEKYIIDCLKEHYNVQEVILLELDRM